MASGRRTTTCLDDIIYPKAIAGDFESCNLYQAASKNASKPLIGC